MIRINLLPFRAARKQENIRRQVSIFFLSIVFVVAVMFYINYLMDRKTERLHREVAALNTEIAKYNLINQEIADIQKKLDILRQRTMVIENLQKNRKESVILLDKLADLVVEKRMWFTNLVADPNQVTISGIALDNKTIADFMTNLEKSRLFASVDLKAAKKQIFQDNLNLKSFEITCNETPEVVPENQQTSKGKAGK